MVVALVIGGILVLLGVGQLIAALRSDDVVQLLFGPILGVALVAVGLAIGLTGYLVATFS